MSALPYAHVSFHISEVEVDLLPGARMKAQVGYGILASYARQLGLPHRPPVIASEQMEGVRCILSVKDPFASTAEEFLPDDGIASMFASSIKYCADLARMLVWQHGLARGLPAHGNVSHARLFIGRLLAWPMV